MERQIFDLLRTSNAVACDAEGPCDKPQRFYTLDTLAEYSALPGTDVMCPGSAAFVKENKGVYFLWPSGWDDVDSPTVTL